MEIKKKKRWQFRCVLLVTLLGLKPTKTSASSPHYVHSNETHHCMFNWLPHVEATQGLLGMGLVILNLDQVTKKAPELALHSANVHTNVRTVNLDRPNMKNPFYTTIFSDIGTRALCCRELSPTLPKME
ncbi:hypothetical protein TNCV_460461 [Trichonephila clavipes]|nr:hypothetical protein TNCV_460461 [Trichonephila clavipes]